MSTVLDSRVIRMIRWLLDQDEPRSTAALAADLGLSQRVVRYRLGAAEAFFDSQGVSLTRRRGSGLFLVAGPADRDRIRAELAQRAQAPRVYARDEREHVVLAHLLWSAPDPTSVDELQEVLEVSKASARRDLQRVEPWLLARSVPLVRRPGVGISIIADEVAIRQAMVQLLLEAVPEAVLAELCVGSVEEAVLTRVRVPAGIREHLSTLPLNTCWRLVERSPISWTLAHGNGELVFSLYLAVTAARLAGGNKISMKPGQQRSLADHPVAATAAAVAASLAVALGLELTEQEVAGITEYLLGLATLAPSESTEDAPRTGDIVDRLLAVAAERIHPTLLDDIELRRGLSEHLDRLAVRLRYGLPVHNPLLDEVTERYPDVYEVAAGLTEILAEDLGASLTADETGFLTMYLAGAMERSRLRPRLRALVVCPSGMATVWVLVSRIQSEFPELEISKVVSARDYEAALVPQVDLVISTVALPTKDAPVAVVSPLLSPADVRKIRHLL